ncbi:olfactory receptor 14A2-like [Tachyglossus aculeatus]|uniref:olfactory receptor 14A2-like n=1 Tax=Tachyglossus aculeatus TaxID=9261 RepID=UPI0018F74E52|nr:olfactory receptor 14A2-like [Tachyglossus aculeatus]
MRMKQKMPNATPVVMVTSTAMWYSEHLVHAMLSLLVYLAALTGNRLHVAVIMNRGPSGKMANASWLSGGLNGGIHTAVTFSLLLCDTTAIRQFFCDIPPFIRLSCSRRYRDEIAVLGPRGFLSLVCFISIVALYTHIFRAVLRMPTIEGRAKAFSTCLPHLSIVILFLSTASFAQLKPPSVSFSTLDLLVSVFYTVAPPALSPLIYGLRNRDMKAALGRVLRWKFFT